MKTILLSLILLSMVFYGCKNQAKTDEHKQEATEEHAHAEGEHNHAEGEEHKHEGEHKHAEGEEHKHEEGHKHAEGDAHDHGVEAEAAADKNHSDEIIFTQAQAAKTTFEVKAIEPSTFHQVIKATGQILAAPGDEAVVVATGNGVVSFNNNKIAEGVAVNKGQTLFHLVSRNMAEGDYSSKVKANYEKMKSEYDRASLLVKDKIVSQKEFESIKLDYENAKIAFDAISANSSGKGVGVTTPISGYIKNILVKEGEYISTGQALATVSQNKRLVLRAEVSEKHYNALKHINSANFKTPYDNKVYALSDLNGRLLSYGKASNSNTFYIPVSFEFDNRGDVIPGSFTEVYLSSSPMENVLAIPVSALTNEMGIFYVYIQLDEEGYRKQEVALGANNGQEVEIVKGLKAGDRVVTQGAYQVKMASASGAIPHGHSH